MVVMVMWWSCGDRVIVDGGNGGHVVFMSMVNGVGHLRVMSIVTSMVVML